MRSWSYTYKTSDGLRHEAEMRAPNKDAVYSALRERGIRAIRVDERVPSIVRRGFGGLRKRDWTCVALAVLAALVAGVFISLHSRQVPTATTVTPSSSAQQVDHSAFLRLQDRVNAVVRQYRTELESVDTELLSNYAALERTDDTADFTTEIEKGRAIVRKGRTAVRETFLALYDAIPETCAEDRETAKRLYGAVIDEILAAAESFDGDALAVDLLDRNRGKWHVVRGEVEWNDGSLAREFSFFRRAPTASVTHWEQDFGGQQKVEKTPLTSEWEK